MIKKDETGTDSPFMISANKEKFTVTAGNVQVMIMKFIVGFFVLSYVFTFFNKPRRKI